MPIEIEIRGLILGALSSIAAVVVLTIVAVVWHRLINTVPTRNFWKLYPADGVIIAISLAQSDPSEHTFYAPAGDLLAFNEIVTLIRRLYPNTKITIHSDQEKPISNWNQTVILIGGGRDNVTARCLLAALDPPMDSRDFELPPNYDFKGLKYREDKQVYLTPSIEGGILSMDCAYVIRTLNPYYPDKHIFIFVGGYTHGTHGAALWATKSKNLVWMQLDYLVRRLPKEIIGSCPKSDSVEVVLQVPAVGPLSEVEISLVGNIEVWNHKGGRRPYYFHTPDGYKNLYVCAFSHMNDEISHRKA